MTAAVWTVLVTGTLCLCGPILADDAGLLERLVERGAEEAATRDLFARWPESPDAPGLEALVLAVEEAVAGQAPIDLVLDKAAEGLAKGVAPAVLLSALARWSADLGEAARMAQDLRAQLDADGVTERETVLRIHLLQQSAPDGSRLQRLHSAASEADAGVRQFLEVSEAVGRLAGFGLAEDEAVAVGQRWLASHVDAHDVATLLRAVEVGGDRMPIAQAAAQVTERAATGWSADEVLAHMDRTGPGDSDAAADPGASATASAAATAPGGIDGRDLSAARGLEDRASAQDEGQQAVSGEAAQDLDDGRGDGAGAADEQGREASADGGEEQDREAGADAGQEQEQETGADVPGEEGRDDESDAVDADPDNEEGQDGDGTADD